MIYLLDGYSKFTLKGQHSKINRLERSLNSIKTIREGQIKKIPQEQIVVGDIICLGPGDMVKVDALCVEISYAMFDESSITGESAKIKKSTIFDYSDEEFDCLESCFVIAGSTLMNGTCTAVVLAVGDRSTLGMICAYMGGQFDDIEIPNSSIIVRSIAELDKLNQYISLFSLILSFLLLVIFSIFEDFSKAAQGWGMFYLEQISRLAFCYGMINRMSIAKIIKPAFDHCIELLTMSQVLVKKIGLIEGLGLTEDIVIEPETVIFSEDSSVERLWNHNFMESSTTPYFSWICEEVRHLFEVVMSSALSVDHSLAVGSFDDLAIGKFLHLEGRGLNLADLQNESPVLSYIPFDYARRTSSAIVQLDESSKIRVEYGHFYEILDKCNYIIDLKTNEISELDGYIKESILRASDEMQECLLRPRAFCYTKITDEDINDDNLSPPETIFMSIIGLRNQLKRGAIEASKKIQEGGVKIRVITPEPPTYAFRVASDLDIIAEEGRMINAKDWLEYLGGYRINEIRQLQIIKPERFEEMYPYMNVIHSAGVIEARIMNVGLMSLKKSNIFVGNNVKALREYEHGLCNGLTATDSTRTQASGILMTGSLSEVSSALEIGRQIFVIINKYTQFINPCAMGIGQLFMNAFMMKLEAPFSLMQMLWVVSS